MTNKEMWIEYEKELLNDVREYQAKPLTENDETECLNCKIHGYTACHFCVLKITRQVINE